MASSRAFAVAVTGLGAVALAAGPGGLVARARLSAAAATADVAASSPAAPPPGDFVVHLGEKRPPLRKSLLGVNQLVPGSTGPLRSVGIHWARIDVSLDAHYRNRPVSNCVSGTFDPVKLDRRVALARQAGASPELLIDYTPDCLTAGAPPGTNASYSPPDDTPAKQAAWDRIIASMATHEISDEGARIFEIWNEPDGTFWTGGLGAYLHMYTDTSRILEEVARRQGVTIEVGGPALVFADAHWVSSLAARAVQDHLPLDFVSWHAYPDDPDLGPFPGLPGGLCPVTGPHPPGTPCFYNPNVSASDVTKGAAAVRTALAPYPSLHPLLWIDEWNLNAGGDPRQSTSYSAAFNVAMLEAAQQAGVANMCFFRAADGTSQGVEGNWGLLTASMKSKPSWWAFRWWDAMSGSTLAVTPSQGVTTEAHQSVTATAAVDASGTVRVLVDDYLPYDPTGHYGGPGTPSLTRRVFLAGLAPGSWTYKVQLVDGSHQGSEVASGTIGSAEASLAVSQPTESILLVTLEPPSGGIGPVAIAFAALGALALLGALSAVVVLIWRRRRSPA